MRLQAVQKSNCKCVTEVEMQAIVDILLTSCKTLLKADKFGQHPADLRY